MQIFVAPALAVAISVVALIAIALCCAMLVRSIGREKILQARFASQFLERQQLLASTQARLQCAEQEQRKLAEEVTVWESLCSETAEKKSRLEDQLADCRKRVEAYQAVLNASNDHLVSKPVAIAQANPARKRDDDFYEIIEGLLPNLKLIDSSIIDLMKERDSRRQILSALYQLNVAPSKVRGERIESAPDWLELRFGVKRLYYRRDNGKFEVLISHKHDQSRDFRYLKKR